MNAQQQTSNRKVTALKCPQNTRWHSSYANVPMGECAYTSVYIYTIKYLEINQAKC